MRRSAFIAGATGAAILGARATADAQLLPGQTYLQQLSVGVSVPLSGPLQKYGTQVVAGVRASIDYVNRYMSAMQGRIYGIRAFDDQDSSTVATTNVQIAANDPSVIAMIGNLTADVTITNIPNYQNVGFALIVPATTDDGVTDRGYRNVFRLPTKDITEGLLFARATTDTATTSRAVSRSRPRTTAIKPTPCSFRPRASIRPTPPGRWSRGNPPSCS